MLDNYFKLKGVADCQVWFLTCFFNNGFPSEKPERSNSTTFHKPGRSTGVSSVPESLTAFAQEHYTQFESEASVQALGTFVTQTTQNGIDDSATDSSSVLATYRDYFKRHNGVEVNYTWTSNAESCNAFRFYGGGSDVNLPITCSFGPSTTDWFATRRHMISLA
jgi:hypothetical protein